MQIHLENLKYYARHGLMPQERATGGDFETDITLTLDDLATEDAVFGDRLDSTVNYAEAIGAVNEEMAEPSALIEHVAGRIGARLLRDFPPVRSVRVKVRKCCPPVNGFAGEGVAVEITLRRRLAIWDFDGTIADTRDSIVRTMTLTLEACGLEVPAETDIADTIGLPLRQSIGRLTGLKDTALDEAVNAYRRIFETKGIKHIRLFPGVADAMHRQVNRGMTVSIATSRGHESTAELCERLGIARYISHIVACEDVTHNKPHAEPVMKLCAQTGTEPADVTVIGDTTYDMEMGANAGADRLIGVIWGNHSAGRLREAGATRIAETTEDI